jgi:hypothetical protein
MTPVEVHCVEPPLFVVTLICWPYWAWSKNETQNIASKIAVKSCQIIDLMSTVLKKAMPMNPNFDCGIQMQVFISSNKGEKDVILSDVVGAWNLPF